MIKELLVLTTILTITTQTTCNPTYYNSPDGSRHLYEIAPTTDKSELYCLVHNSVESVYRLSPNIQEVEGNNDIVHQVYQNINDLDINIMSFAHKLGDIDESDYLLKIKVDGEEDVYFVLPKENNND